MPVTAKTEVVGVRDTIRQLNKIEPGLRKQFTADAARIAQPAISEVQASYVKVPLSGMARQWRDTRGRKLFPFDLGKARRGVNLRVDARRDALGVIYIQQRDPGTAVFESAGRRTINLLGLSLGPLERNKTRILGPAVFRRRAAVTREMAELVRDTMRRTQRSI